MATVKVKYRPSVQEGKEGTIYYQIIHNRIIRQIRTDYRIFREEWDKNKSSVTVITGGRKAFLRTVSDDVARDLKRLNAIIGRLEEGGDVFTADDVVKKFLEPADGAVLLPFHGGDHRSAGTAEQDPHVGNLYDCFKQLHAVPGRPGRTAR